MLTIRLTRKGKKNQPFFRVVVIDKRRSSKGGRAVEELGYVDPLKKRKSFKKERIQYWLSKGAKPSATIHNLLVSEKIIDAKKIHVAKKSKKPAEVATPSTPGVGGETPGVAQESTGVRPDLTQTGPAPAETPAEVTGGTSDVPPTEPDQSSADIKPGEEPKTEAPKETE